MKIIRLEVKDDSAIIKKLERIKESTGISTDAGAMKFAIIWLEKQIKNGEM